MIHFMYHGKYDAAHVLPPVEDEIGSAMLLHVHVVGLAQKYFVEPLQVYAGEQAVGLMKEWDGASSFFAEAVHAIYTGTEDIASGTSLRESAVSVAIDHALLVFGPTSEHWFHTRDVLLDETPGFMEDWARAMSYCNDSLTTVNTNLEAINDILNDDNVKLNDRYRKYKDAYEKLNTAAEEVKERSRKGDEEYNKLADEYEALKEKTKVQFSMPDKPTANTTYVPSGPAPDCYKCPNCELLFFRVIPWSGSYHHPCFDNGWCGKLGKGGVQLWYNQWQEHLVRKA